MQSGVTVGHGLCGFAREGDRIYGAPGSPGLQAPSQDPGTFLWSPGRSVWDPAAPPNLPSHSTARPCRVYPAICCQSA